ncbi:TetR/AcrR family transcriptional regulator [Levilactobacillus wangkuiensis]|uniref:TetR/AcrR family transcriptional regulator n=1 Tax=Levilactobacillus wangkuiensis TaxID=2799566 RepID=UPI0019441A19|nr:TetR/AcrR family transcriptional regulator [Levilactobacillus wangkuiensis]
MTTKRELNAQHHQQVILATAAKYFKRDGVQATSITAIAKQAKVSTRTLYKYFPNKNELAHAVYLADIDNGIATNLAILHDSQLDFQAKLTKMMTKQLDLSQQLNPDYLRYAADDFQGKTGHPETGPNYLAKLDAFWSELIDLGVSSGGIKQQHSPAALRIYIQAFFNLGQTTITDQRVLTDLIQLFFNGLNGQTNG